MSYGKTAVYLLLISAGVALSADHACATGIQDLDSGNSRGGPPCRESDCDPTAKPGTRSS